MRPGSGPGFTAHKEDTMINAEDLQPAMAGLEEDYLTRKKEG